MLLNEFTNTSQQLDEIDWKSIQKSAGKVAKGAQKFTKNVAQTGQAVGQAASAIGGAAKEVGKQLVAKPVAATYGAAKTGLGKAADITKGVYGDVKKGAQALGQAAGTVAKDVGKGVANVAGGTAKGIGAVAGGATTGLGRAAAKGFNTGVQAVGGDAANRLQTNVFKKQPGVAGATATKPGEIATQTGAINPATGQAYVPSDFPDENPAPPPAANAATAGVTPPPPGSVTPVASTDLTQPPAPPTAGRVSVKQAKASIDQTVKLLSQVRARDRSAVVAYAQKAINRMATSAPAATTTKAPATGKPPRVSAPPPAGAPTAAERARLDQMIAAATARQPVSEALEWSQAFDPSVTLLRQIGR